MPSNKDPEKNRKYMREWRARQDRQKRREYMRRWHYQRQQHPVHGTIDPERPETYVECVICGEKLRQIYHAHLRLHGITTAEYKAQGHPICCEELAHQNSERLREMARGHTGERHPNWKGGHKSKISGYVYISRNGQRMYAHRAIMEDHLGRPLRPDEQIHHKDGNRANNSLDNLVLISPAEHGAVTGRRSHGSWRRLGVMAIRLLLEQGWELYDISSEFHVSIETLIRVLHRYPDHLTDYTARG